MAETCLPAAMKERAAGEETEEVRRTVMGLSGLRPLLRLEDCRVRAGTGLNPAGLGGTAGR